MMHQESGSWTDATSAPARGVAANSVSVLAYRSRAVAPMSNEDLDRLLRSAQERNRLQGLTGLLIYDHGFFFQWLEGPRLELLQVWDSIRRDQRHRDIKILRQDSLPQRFFKGWEMRFAPRARGDIEKVLAVMDLPQDLLSRLRVPPSVLSSNAWDQVLGKDVIPRIRSAHTEQSWSGHHSWMSPTRTIWHAQRGAGEGLARILLAVNPADTSRYVDDLIDQGAGITALYHEVFEPAARFLGNLNEDDRCDDFTVTLALGRLQVEVRRLGNALFPDRYVAPPGHAILVAPQPGEAHGIGATLCSDLFAREGWDVSYEISCNDEGLRELLHENWFDVLELSSSKAVRRDQQLQAMRLTILGARAASLNPSLAVIVDGRSFLEQPQAFLEVGADVGCATVTEALPAAERLLESTSTRTLSVS